MLGIERHCQCLTCMRALPSRGAKNQPARGLVPFRAAANFALVGLHERAWAGRRIIQKAIGRAMVIRKSNVIKFPQPIHPERKDDV
jgi:hypothetical protein